MTVPFAALQRQQPLAPQIIEQLRERIEQRQLRPGARAPSIRQLARELQVSPSTVVEAYDRLAALGYLQARRGAGSVPLVSTATSKPCACKASISKASSCNSGSPPVHTT